MDAATQVYAHDSPLGRWTISLRRIHPALAGCVSQLWLGEGSVTYQRDRILPRGQSYLLINLGPPQYMVLPGPPETRVVFDDLWYSGIAEYPIDTEAPHGNVLLGIAFPATGAATWLPLPQAELANRTGPLADVMGAGVLELRDHLLELRDSASRLALAEAWLLRVCLSGRSIHPLVHWATHRLMESRGGLRTEALAREAGVSRKHLAGLFQRQVGLTPKSLARVHRFQSALIGMQRFPLPDYSELALDCGYYDQAHLIRDFRQFAGMTPAEVARSAMPDSGSVVLR